MEAHLGMSGSSGAPRPGDDQSPAEVGGCLAQACIGSAMLMWCGMWYMHGWAVGCAPCLQGGSGQQVSTGWHGVVKPNDHWGGTPLIVARLWLAVGADAVGVCYSVHGVQGVSQAVVLVQQRHKIAFIVVVCTSQLLSVTI